MLKRLIHSIFLCFLMVSANAQVIGDEWIDYNRKYLKIPVWEEGVYRLQFGDLNQALNNIGENIFSIPVSEIQIYRNGEEIPLYFNGDTDQDFEVGESFWFYGYQNDGMIDSSLYLNDEQIHHYYSLFNDTAYYFVSWGSSGKRFDEIQVFNSSNTADYIWYEQLELYANGYQYGERNLFGSTDPEYRIGEGYFDGNTGNGSFGYTQNRLKNVPNQLVYNQPNAPDAELESAIIPVIGDRHSIDLQYGNPLRSLGVQDWVGSSAAFYQANIPVSDMGTSQTAFRYFSYTTNPPPANNTARYAISHFKLKYPRQLNLAFGDFLRFQCLQSSDSLTYQFSNALSGKYFLFDPENREFQELNVVSSSLNFSLIPGPERELILFHSSALQNVNQVLAAGNAGVFTDYSTLAADSSFLIITHPSLIQAANDYATYKNSKGLGALVVNVEDLYEQYAYGVRKHPLAIKNFCRRAIDSWTSDPAYLFLVGKGISSHLTRKNADNFGDNLVPTFGYPSCDNLFTTRINGSLYDPVIPTGRLSARTLQDVRDYLQKVQEFDRAIDTVDQKLENQIWKKRILHFAGGTSQAEQDLFERYLTNYGRIASDSIFAGEVFTFYKNSSSAIQTNISDSVKLLIDDGVALMTFFGHGAGGQLGFSIGDPETYENQGKYPFMIANSCNVGNIFLEDVGSRSLNEEFILAKQRGVIGFISSVENGYPYNLDEYTVAFYRNFSRHSYGASLGEIMQKTIRDIQRPSPVVKWTCLEMSLHGDPSLSLYPAKFPELSVVENSIEVSPEQLSVDLDSFNIMVNIDNLGRSSSQNFPVRLHHSSSAGLDTSYTVFVNGINRRTEVNFNILMNKELMPGENQFELEIDLPENNVAEAFDTENNRLSFELLITSDELIPVIPANYAVIPDSFPTLVAYTSEQNAPRREYYFQLDTTNSFDSPILQEKILISDGGIVRWTPDYAYFPDSVVYYWRCSPNNFYAQDMKWRERSFQYIPSKTGRGQAHIDQLRQNRLDYLEYQSDSRSFEFIPVRRKLSVKNRGNPSFGADFQELYDILFRLDGVIQGQGVCAARRSMHVAVIDPISLECWPADKYLLGQYNETGGCRNFLPKQFMFDVEANDDLDSMVSLLNKYVPDGHYILAYSGIYARFQEANRWSNAHFKAFEDLGADSIRFVENDHPYIFFCKKGDPASAIEVLGNTPKDVISLEVDLESRGSFGYSTSAEMELLSEINLFSGKISSSANEATEARVYFDDVAAISVYNNSWYIDTLQLISSSEAKVRVMVEDSTNRTAPQLKYWHVLGPEVPEICINPSLSAGIDKDYYEEGESINLSFGIENISRVDMPEHKLLIEFISDDASQDKIECFYDMEALTAGKNHTRDMNFSSLGMSGEMRLRLTVNPKDSSWVKELKQFNNSTEYSFFVASDDLNPLLDVRFDGKYIKDGQYVHSDPLISFQVIDLNTYIDIQDTLNLQVWFEENNEGFSPLSYANGDLRLVQKDDSLKLLVHFEPDLEPGAYRIRANAKDVKGNSAATDYEISFRVNDEPGIVSYGAYPNPFRDHTLFRLDIWGAETPEDLRIEIFDTKGTLINALELGKSPELRVDENQVELYWNGTDKDGQSLPAGTYFYEVHSEQLKSFEPGSIPKGKLILIK